jgi:hypothetical protein
MSGGLYLQWIDFKGRNSFFVGCVMNCDVCLTDVCRVLTGHDARVGISLKNMQ